MGNSIKTEGKRIWMYWPAKYARGYKENVENNLMSLTLPTDQKTGNKRILGDLKECIGNPSKLRDEVQKAYGEGRDIDKGGFDIINALINEMKEGDIVIAGRYYDAVVGIGVVEGDYFYDGTRNEKQCRRVNWMASDVCPAENLYFRGSSKISYMRLQEVPADKIEEAIKVIEEMCGTDYGLAESVTAQETIPSKAITKQATVRKPASSKNISHAAFMRLARLHQEQIVKEWGKEMGKEIWNDKPGRGVELKEEYAKAGLIFYEGFRKDIIDLYRSGNTKIGMMMLRNALRSEHIPYNLFFPMMQKENKEQTKDFFNELLATDAVAEVIEMRIEYAPQPREEYLYDGTSFDAFLLYRHKDGAKGAIGIEIKYTEKEYFIGDREYHNTHDAKGNVKLSKEYSKATTGSGYYKPNTEALLVEDELRQIWRNHILGASMVLHGDIEHFTSVTIFPNKNPHFHVAGPHYREVLTEKGNDSFKTYTYEHVFSLLAKHFTSEEHVKWVSYLNDRYLFDNEKIFQSANCIENLKKETNNEIEEKTSDTESNDSNLIVYIVVFILLAIVFAFLF